MTGASGIRKAIKEIGRTSETIRTKIALVAAQCVVHAIEHGDVTLATELTEAMGDGWRINSLRQWFIDFGPFVWAEVETVDELGNKKVKKAFKLNRSRREELLPIITSDLPKFGTSLMATPFWVYKPEPEFKPFDMLAELTKVLTRAKKTMDDKTNSSNPKNSFEGLGDLALLIQKVKTMKPNVSSEKASIVEDQSADAEELISVG